MLVGGEAARLWQMPALRPPPFAAAKIPFGNRVLTMIGVWLEA